MWSRYSPAGRLLRILNDACARMPAHTFDTPVPITARIVWTEDGEEYIETIGSRRYGWTPRT
jgi:hypothetical protein